MKTYKTWEAIKMLTENPKLKFNLYYCGHETADKNLEVADRRIVINVQGPFHGYLLINAEWILVQQPVSFMEAVKAFREDKTIYCKLDRYTYTFRTNLMELKDVDGNPITPREIVDGKWFIEEGENIED